MLLFIDRLPLHHHDETGIDAISTLWTVPVAILPTDPGAEVPQAGLQLQRWVLDMSFYGEAFAWRHHLQEVHLDPDEYLSGPLHLPTPFGDQYLPLRNADLWLFSNIPALWHRPVPLRLDAGVFLNNVTRLPAAEINRPRLGIIALRDNDIRVEVDFKNDTVSVWVPSSIRTKGLVFAQRTAQFFGRIDAPWNKRVPDHVRPLELPATGRLS